jgi:hypothetical protein
MVPVLKHVSVDRKTFFPYHCRAKKNICGVTGIHDLTRYEVQTWFYLWPSEFHLHRHHLSSSVFAILTSDNGDMSPIEGRT